MKRCTVSGDVTGAVYDRDDDLSYPSLAFWGANFWDMYKRWRYGNGLASAASDTYSHLPRINSLSGTALNTSWETLLNVLPAGLRTRWCQQFFFDMVNQSANVTSLARAQRGREMDVSLLAHILQVLLAVV